MTQSGSFADPTDAQTVRKNFFSFYKDRWDSYIRNDGKSNWKQLSKYAYLTDEKLISVVDGQVELPMAFNFDTKARFVVLLIEVEDKLSRATIFDSTIEALSTIGCNRTPSYIVNELGHIHLYLNFDRSPDHARLKGLLDTWLRLSSLETHVRVLGPNDLIEVPLQPYFTWIQAGLKAIVRRRDIALDAAISMFMSDIRKSRLEYEAFMERLSQHVQESKNIPLPTSFASLSGQIRQQDQSQDSPDNERSPENQQPVQEGELSRHGESDPYGLSRQSRRTTLSLVKNSTQEEILDFTPDGITPAHIGQHQEDTGGKISSRGPDQNNLEESGQSGQNLSLVKQPYSKNDSMLPIEESLEHSMGLLVDPLPSEPEQERESNEPFEAQNYGQAIRQKAEPECPDGHFDEVDDDRDNFSDALEAPECPEDSLEDGVLFSPGPVRKTMHPPPGATTFNQLMIPFPKNDGAQTISDNFKDWRGPP
ncbi:MAG: hypothetical protein AB7W16_20405 [Candidatus Obscuribacterales bacterium]